jgi:hypothetical protein
MRFRNGLLGGSQGAMAGTLENTGARLLSVVAPISVERWSAKRAGQIAPFQPERLENAPLRPSIARRRIRWRTVQTI